jgi:hypothetical protein
MTGIGFGVFILMLILVLSLFGMISCLEEKVESLEKRMKEIAPRLNP